MIRILSINVKFHPLFAILCLMSVITGYFIEIMVLFGIVIIHEIGHVVAAKCFNWKMSEVHLLPFGGVAVTDEWGKTPAKEELIVAAAGPLQNIWMIAVALLLQWSGMWSLEWSAYFIRANAIIAAFNLLPILPLDGGRIMQSLFSYSMSYYKAIIISVWISIIGSIVIIIIAVSWGSGGLMLNLLAIGLFLLYTNWQGRRYIQYQFMRFLMNRRNRMDERVDSGTIAEPIAVSLHSQITDIMYLFKKEKYHLIYVINEHGRLHGVVTEERVMHTYLLENKHGSAVSELFL